MPTLDQHHSDKILKLLYMGDSGAGKTGSLVSLVAVGYKLRIVDFDNGLDVLAAYVRKECPDKLNAISYITFRDKFKAGPTGPIVDGVPKAYVNALKLMSKWDDETVPSAWGPDHVLVVDSLTGLGKAAFEWAKGISPMVKDPRQWYSAAQQSVDQFISLVTSEAFATNVIIIAHVQNVEGPDGLMHGYANTVGKALGPLIPTYFNNVVLALRTGDGANARRMIKTIPTSMVDLKNSAPFKLDAELPLGTGLATLFSKLKET